MKAMPAAKPDGSAIERTVHRLEEFLAVSALSNRPFHEIMDEFGQMSRAGGITLARLMIGWRLLHPLYLSQSLYWRPERGVLVERYRHGEAMMSAAFERSPIRTLLSTDTEEIRRRLRGANAVHDYPIAAELEAEGFTDYVIMKVGFGDHIQEDTPGSGAIMSFVSDGEDGFCDAQMHGLRRLKYMLGLAVRVAMERDMSFTLARTYLGRATAEKVLKGQILRSEGEAVQAVIWYCDLRDSSALCEAMGVADYLPLLNDYFSATAGAVSAAGGDVLDFIGDAVLAIFPHSPDGFRKAHEATEDALDRLLAFRNTHKVLADRRTLADVAGIAMDFGTVNHGNIGIPERLAFSVIGSTVNKVARIERLTKLLRAPVLATAPVAAWQPKSWVSRGPFRLEGHAQDVEIFARAG